MSKIKECFTSRFEDGFIVEMDYSQLEVIGLAVLSKDPQLISDLKSGNDLHCVNLASMEGKDYQYVKDQVDKNKSEWVKKRKEIKPLSFQLQYGAGAKSMAESNGVPVKYAQKFIDTYYARYPSVKQWQENNIETVKQYSEPSGKHSGMGFPVNKGYLPSPTGRTYEFIEYDAPEFMREKGQYTSFSPTQIKNYPVQGFSTGDIVPLAIGKMMRFLINANLHDRILLVNTIHDSILFDCVSLEVFRATQSGGDLFDVLGNLKRILESIVHDANELWPDLDFDLPLKVDVECGTHWGNMKHLRC